MSARQELVDYGTAKETELLPVIEKVLNLKLKQTKERFEGIDFYNRKARVMVELKSRRFKSDLYEKTMIGLNKLDYLKIEKLKDFDMYFFFSFTDGLYYLKYDPTIKYNKNKQNLFIPIADLTKVEA